MKKSYQHHEPTRAKFYASHSEPSTWDNDYLPTSDAGKAVPHPKRPNQSSGFIQRQSHHIHDRRRRQRVADGLRAMNRPRKDRFFPW